MLHNTKFLSENFSSSKTLFAKRYGSYVELNPLFPILQIVMRLSSSQVTFTWGGCRVGANTLLPWGKFSNKKNPLFIQPWCRASPVVQITLRTHKYNGEIVTIKQLYPAHFNSSPNLVQCGECLYITARYFHYPLFKKYLFKFKKFKIFKYSRVNRTVQSLKFEWHIKKSVFWETLEKVLFKI